MEDSKIAALDASVARGEVEAAEELLEEARSRHDIKRVLACWEVLWPHRHTAIQALRAARRAAGWIQFPRDLDVEAKSEQRRTARLRDDVVTRALVDSYEGHPDSEDVVGAELIAQTRRVLDAKRDPTDTDSSVEPMFLELDRRLSRVLLVGSEESALSSELAGVATLVSEIRDALGYAPG